ncbi:MAG: tyrosine-type recombinase/integrase, partial [Bacteroidales bacterium]
YFLKEHGLRPNTIQGLIVGLQGLCKKAGTYGFKVSGDYDEFHSSGEKTSEIALSMNDVTRIFYFDKLTKKQKEIRDLFIVGCMTGLRYSDYSRLSLEYIHEGIITIRTKKTGTVVYIPVHPYVQDILNRNEGKIPAVGKSISYFNRYIKLICEKVGMTEVIPKVRVIGFDSVKEEKRKCDMIGSHTARRSFATIMYNSGKFTAAQIMLITGHSSEKSFFRYIRINPEDNARAIAATMKSLM